MSTQSKPRTIVIAALSAGLIVLAWLLWRQQVQLELLRQDNARLTEQARLFQPGRLTSKSGTAGAPAATVKGSSVPADNSTTASAPAAGTGVTAGASSTAPLVLGAIGVQPLANPAYPDGLRATLPFARNRADPLGVTHVFVRLPKNSSCRIVDFTPADAAGYTNVRKYVKADGKFAAFEGTPTAAGPLQLELSVSTSVNADVRGACEIGAIGPYQVELSPAGAIARGE